MMFFFELLVLFFFFFKQKTAYEIVSGDSSSDVCSSDLNFGKQVQQASGQLQLALTSPAHLATPSAAGVFATERPAKYDVRPAGNAVNLEDEMMKVAANQMDHQAAISLYSRSMGLLKTAIGKGQG